MLPFFRKEGEGQYTYNLDFLIFTPFIYSPLPNKCWANPLIYFLYLRKIYAVRKSWAPPLSRYHQHIKGYTFYTIKGRDNMVRFINYADFMCRELLNDCKTSNTWCNTFSLQKNTISHVLLKIKTVSKSCKRHCISRRKQNKIRIIFLKFVLIEIYKLFLKQFH